MEARQELQGLGGELVVGFNAHLSIVRAWLRDSGLPQDLTVFADPDAALYEALGTKRQNPLSLVATQLVPGLRSARRGLLPKATKADMQRLGADVAVRADGEIARVHVASNADDRVAIEELIAALRPSAA